MTDQERAPPQTMAEISRARVLAKATADLRARAMELVKHLEAEEVPDFKDLAVLHRRLVREEKALASLLKPMPVTGKGKRRVKTSKKR